jgi:hypothetical protein
MWNIPYASCVDQSRIQSFIFVLVNLESSYALPQYLERHKEFFILLHALSISQSYLNSWDHHDLDIESYLEFFSCNQTLKILRHLGLTHKLEHGLLEFYIRTTSLFLLLDHIGFISSYSMILIPILKIYLYLHGIQALNPTYGLQAIPMTNSFIKSSMKTLVHRDCH